MGDEALPARATPNDGGAIRATPNDGGAIRATMNDVAEHAGVSIKSVSRVINAEPHVSGKLRARVEAAIAALNYVPDMAARSLAGARNFSIGILFDNPSPNYTMKILAGAYRACSARSYHVRVDTLDSNVEPEALLRQLETMVANGRSDGFILTPPLTDIPLVLDFLEARAIRYIRIAPVTSPGRSPAVAIDDAAAAGELAALLWGQGHRHFGLLTGPAAHGAAEQRRKGFMEKLRALGTGWTLAEADGGFSFERGIAGGRELLATSPRPTAIFGANDDSAAGAMVAAAEAGLKVPRDLSVCGFDDSWVAMSVWPYLTTIYQPIEELAEYAAHQLIDRAQGAPPHVQHMLDYRLIKRGSVAVAP